MSRICCPNAESMSRMKWSAAGRFSLAWGVVTLSLINWNLPTVADFDAWYFKGLACRSIVHIGPISLNVTMPLGLMLL